MSVATDYSHYSNLVKASDSDNTTLFQDVVTVNESAQNHTYAVGTVLGKVSASGKYKISVQNAADGSQTPIAEVVGDSLVMLLHSLLLLQLILKY